MARSVTIFTHYTLIHTTAIYTHITIFAAAGTGLRLVKRARSVNAAIAAETLPGGGAGIGVGCAVSTGTSTVGFLVAILRTFLEKPYRPVGWVERITPKPSKL